MKVMGRSRSFFRICLIIWTIGSRISTVWLSNRRGIRKYRKKQEIQNGTKRKIYCRVRSLTNAEKRHALWIRPVFGFSCQRRLCSSILRGDLSDILAFFFDCLPLFWPLTPYPCSIAMHLTLLLVSSHFLHSLTSSSLNPLTSYPPPTSDITLEAQHSPGILWEQQRRGRGRDSSPSTKSRPREEPGGHCVTQHKSKST